MIFDRCAGPEEGAALIFAHTAKEARVEAWRKRHLFIYSDIEWVDIAILRLWNSPWLIREALVGKLENDEVHIIDEPKSCNVCESWGHSSIGDDGYCDRCRERIDEDYEETILNGYCAGPTRKRRV